MTIVICAVTVAVRSGMPSRASSPPNFAASVSPE